MLRRGAVLLSLRSVSIEPSSHAMTIHTQNAAPSATATATASSSIPSTSSSKPLVNLLDLAAACVASTVTASRTIAQLQQEKNTRLKQDGSYVTDADFVAQGVIVQAIHKVCKDIAIVGEESPEEMEQHTLPDLSDNTELLQRARTEIDGVYQRHVMKSQRDSLLERMPLAGDGLPLDPALQASFPGQDNGELPQDGASDATATGNTSLMVDPARIRVIVDPLDGTRSYAKGEYDAVSILICITLDDEPHFGVVGKPFGYTGLKPIYNSNCATVYGGKLLNAVYVAGGRQVQAQALSKQPRAVISSSRSAGVVQDFCVYLANTHQLLHPEPLHISGAGEKSLRIVLPREEEALWFFPKPGTSRWDVAATDALLRVLNGKLTDKFGRNFDYNVTREQAENVDGVVACSNASLHSQCIRLFGEWENLEKR